MPIRTIICNFLIYSTLLISLNNFIVGKTRIWPVGHLGFFGLGMFIVGILSIKLCINFWIAVGVAIIVGSITAIVLVIFAKKLKEDFFVVASIAICSIIYTGQEAIKPGGYESDRALTNMDPLILILIWFLIVIFFAGRFYRTPLERILSLVRHDKNLAKVLGISPDYYNSGCLIIGSVLATITGCLYSSNIKATDPEMATLYGSFLIFALVIFGGLNSILGSIIGAAMISLVPEVLSEILKRIGLFDPDEVMKFIVGIMLVIFLIWRPQGILGKNGYFFDKKQII